MSSYFAIDKLTLRPLFGTQYRPLDKEALIARFGAQASDPRFFLTALGDVQPGSPTDMAELYDAGLLRAFVPTEQPDQAAEPVLFVSTVVGLPLSFVYSSQGFDAEAAPRGLLVLADAVFAANPHAQWLLTTMFAPPPPMAEDSLSAWGFERVGRPTDAQGTQSWGIMRAVAQMVLQQLG